VGRKFQDDPPKDAIGGWDMWNKDEEAQKLAEAHYKVVLD
jgi:hypothetical protein